MFESLNWGAVLVATLSSFMLGGLWYSPMMFLNPWCQDLGVDPEKGGHPAKVFGLAFIFSLIGCIVMASMLPNDADVVAGVILGLKIGIGFVFCSFGVNYQFANRSFRALFIDGGYHTLQFVMFGLILTLWPW